METWFCCGSSISRKAYPRVCRPALWRVLQRRGCPRSMVKVLQALRNHTAMRVRVWGVSSGYLPDRGLREGCPSSPVLFNIYRDAVLQDFRTRRSREAQARGQVPGLEWEFKVDGALRKTQAERKQKGWLTPSLVFGEFGRGGRGGPTCGKTLQ